MPEKIDAVQVQILKLRSALVKFAILQKKTCTQASSHSQDRGWATKTPSSN